MNTSVAASTTSQPPVRTQTQATLSTALTPAATASAASTGAVPDRITSHTPVAPLLTIGAAALVQLIPGAVEAEGAVGVATAVRIGVEAALTNPVVRCAAGAATLAVGNYARSLAGDALNGQSALKPLLDAGKSLDASIHAGLGIPQSSQR